VLPRAPSKYVLISIIFKLLQVTLINECNNN